MSDTRKQVAGLMGVAGMVLCLAIATPAKAQIFPDLASEHTQVLNHIELVVQVKKLVDQLDMMKKQLWTQIDMLSDLNVNSYLVYDFEWGRVTEELKKLHELFEHSRALVYTARDLEQEFRTRYKSYKEWSHERPETGDLVKKYEQWSDETADNIKITLRAAGLQADQFEDEDEVLGNLKWQSSSSEGRNQLLQVGHQLAVQEIGQLQKLRQLMMLQIQMHTEAAAAAADRDAMQRAQHRQFTRILDVPVDNGKDYSNF